MRLRSIVIPVSMVVVSFLLVVGISGVASTPAQAQEDCMSQERCAALRDELRDHRGEGRQLKREMRKLRRQLRDLPQDSPEREELRQELRRLRQDGRQLRRETRPIRRELREGCRGCFDGGDDKTDN